MTGDSDLAENEQQSDVQLKILRQIYVEKAAKIRTMLDMYKGM